MPSSVHIVNFRSRWEILSLYRAPVTRYTSICRWYKKKVLKPLVARNAVTFILDPTVLSNTDQYKYTDHFEWASLCHSHITDYCFMFVYHNSLAIFSLLKLLEERSLIMIINYDDLPILRFCGTILMPHYFCLCFLETTVNICMTTRNFSGKSKPRWLYISEPMLSCEDCH